MPTYDEMQAAGVAAERAYFDAAIADYTQQIHDLEAMLNLRAKAYADLSELHQDLSDRHDAYVAANPATPEPTTAPLRMGVSLQDQSAYTYEEFKAEHPWVAGQRIFHTPNDLPDTYQSSKARHLTEGRQMVSFKPPIHTMQDGSAGPWARRFGQTCPEGTYFVCQHEPENKAKGISPAAFVSATNGLFSAMGATPARRTVILMEYQFARQGTAYLDGINPANLDTVGADFYSTTGDRRTVQELCEPFFDACRDLFPGTELVIGELGVSKQSQWADHRGEWLRDGMAWLDAQPDVEFAYYYQTTIGGEADWALTPAELAVAFPRKDETLDLYSIRSPGMTARADDA